MNREELNILKLPDSPGIYKFISEDGRILYIGKAASLRDRVRSYFAADLVESRNPAVAAMVNEAKTVEWQTTGSVLEALILEANLIKRHQPRINVASKDNKSFNYLVITKERFPRVVVVRGRELYQRWSEKDIKDAFGPYPHGLQLQDAVKIVRKIFPFRDSKCTPCEDQISGFRKSRYRDLRNPDMRREEQEQTDKSDLSGQVRLVGCRPCFNRQLGLCPGVCTGEISREIYAAQVKHICELFSGNFHGLKRNLTKEMRQAARDENYERAETVRRQCAALEHIRDVSLIKSEKLISSGGGVRIEAFDVAHTSGDETVAVMTVVDNGHAYKDAYRMFKIRTAKNNDIAALKEALSRRLSHAEWPLPRVFVVDGGKAQVRGAEKVLDAAGIKIPVVGVVKDEYHKPERLIGSTTVIQAHEADIITANAESHRFGLQWHQKRRRRALI